MMRRQILILLLLAVVAPPMSSDGLARYTPDASFKVNTYSMSTGMAGSSAWSAKTGTSSVWADNSSVFTPMMRTTSDYSMLRHSYIPLAARNLRGGTLTEQPATVSGPRRVIIHDDDDEEGYGDEELRPADPNDPYFTPVGDMSVGMILVFVVLAVAICYRKARKTSRA